MIYKKNNLYRHHKSLLNKNSIFQNIQTNRTLNFIAPNFFVSVKCFTYTHFCKILLSNVWTPKTSVNSYKLDCLIIEIFVSHKLCVNFTYTLNSSQDKKGRWKYQFNFRMNEFLGTRMTKINFFMNFSRGSLKVSSEALIGRFGKV